ncbi:hypothetical protein protein [Bacillus cereus G9241]|nr:hypothetical protein protein [Bacillus cereus G9241]
MEALFEIGLGFGMLVINTWNEAVIVLFALMLPILMLAGVAPG